MSSYCRLCLEATAKFELIDDVNAVTNRQKIENFLPEMTIDTVDFCVLCPNCAKILQDMYKFKSKCLETEEIITNYMQNNNIAGQVSLKNVIDSLNENMYENGFELVQCHNIDDGKEGNEKDSTVLDNRSTDVVEVKKEMNETFSEVEIKLETCEEIDLKMDVQSSYKCHACKEIFSRLSTFQKHMKTHVTGLTCSTCGKIFKSQYQYKKHVLLHKTKCMICEKVFARQYQLKTHLEEIHGCMYELGRYKCTQCEAIFYTQSALCKHEAATHFSKNEGKDDNCNAFNSAYRSDRHPKTRKLDCKVCGKLFSGHSHLTSHLVRVHGCTERTKKHRCEHCEATFYTEIELDKHAKLHSKTKTEKGYICDICKAVLSSTRELKKHGQLHINVECSYCHMTMRKSSMKDHLRTHTGERPFKCEKCGKGFTQSGTLYTHLRHTHNSLKRFICDICQMKFKFAVSFRLHMEKHSGKVDKPHICEVCGKAFRVAFAMKKHKLRHTNEKNHTCFICGKGFVDSSGLKRHTKIHTGEKPYQCNVCEYRSNRQSNLRVHMKSHLRKIKIE